MQAWRRALDDLSVSREGTRRAHPVDALRKALQAYAICCMSTSGIEQGFSKTAWGFTNRQMKALPLTEAMVTKIMLDAPMHEQAWLVDQARHIWVVTFRPERVARKTRADRGINRPRRETEADTPTTEVDFTRKRRRAAASDLARPSSIATQQIKDSDTWTEKHNRELMFMQRKRHLRFRHAAAERSLVDRPDRLIRLCEEAQEVEERQIHEEQCRRKRAMAHTRRQEGQDGRQLIASISGQQVFVDVKHQSPCLAASLRRHRLEEAQPHLASVWVVDRPGEHDGHSMTTHVCSSVLGGFQVTQDFVISDGRQGVAVRFLAAADRVRVIYFTPSCVQHHRTYLAWQTRAVEAKRHRGGGVRWTCITGQPMHQVMARLTQSQAKALEIVVANAADRRAP